MIYRLSFKNFKCFDSFEIDFKEGKTKESAKNFILLYGENGIGKSSIVDAFQLLLSSSKSLINIREYNEMVADDEDEERLFISPSDYIRKYRIDYFIKDLVKISSTEPMSLTFCFYDKGSNSYEYSMVFNQTDIIGECLLCNKKTVFSIKDRQLKHNISASTEFVNKLNEYKNMYFGKHTLLSCLRYLFEDFSREFIKESISKSLLVFMIELRKIDIFRPLDNAFEKYSFIDNNRLLPNLVRGKYTDNLKEKLANTKDVLSRFFSIHRPNIKGVDYVITKIDGNIKKYSLVFLERSGDKIIKIPFSLESTGIKKLVALFTYFYEAFSNDSISLIDEIDSGIGIPLLKNIVDSFNINEIKGQLILTTHNLFLMKESYKKSVYLMKKDENYQVVVSTLDSYKREIQPNTDIVGKYLKNKFGGVFIEDTQQSFVDLISQKKQES